MNDDDMTRYYSLAASIKKVRPDLEEKMSVSLEVGEESIPETPPPEFFRSNVNEIEDIGEPINACFFTKSHSDPTNWYTS